MSTQLIGVISGVIVVISIIPYAIRVDQGKIKTNLTTWFLWTLIGLAILLNYNSSGAGDSIWPVIFGFTNPLLILMLTIKQKGKFVNPNWTERVCLTLGIISLILWIILHQNKEFVQYALYTSILADMSAATPTIFWVYTNPTADRPFPWFVFAMGYGLSIFAIENPCFVNYALIGWMCCGSLIIFLPLFVYRLKNRVPLREWI